MGCCDKDKKAGCQKPEACKDTPKKCTPEQIRECHGDVKEHPCVKAQEKKEEQ